MWWMATIAMAGPPQPVMCPDGEPVLPPRKVKVCEKPFRMWAKNLEVSVRANASALDGGASVGTEAVELSGDVAKTLRTQASALCVGMMTAPCTVKDDYLPLVREMPELMIALERARSGTELLDALEEVDRLSGTGNAEAVAAQEPAPPSCKKSTFVLSGGDSKHIHAIGEGTWSLQVAARGGGVDGGGVLLRWDSMSCSSEDGASLTDGVSPAALSHAMRCKAPPSGDSLWVVNPQGGLLDGSPARAEVELSLCEVKL